MMLPIYIWIKRDGPQIRAWWSDWLAMGDSMKESLPVDKTKTTKNSAKSRHAMKVGFIIIYHCYCYTYIPQLNVLPNSLVLVLAPSTWLMAHGSWLMAHPVLSFVFSFPLDTGQDAAFHESDTTIQYVAVAPLSFLDSCSTLGDY